MSNGAFWIKQGNTLEVLERTLYNSDDTPVDLTNATVRFHMHLPGESEMQVDDEANIVGTETDGNVKYIWKSGDTDTPGAFEAEFEVTFAGGGRITVPNNAHLTVNVVPRKA